MGRENCWEFMKCGREPGGAKVAELEICPAATGTRTDGINRGKNGGRACWAIRGTRCGEKIHGVVDETFTNCIGCIFQSIVSREEGESFVTGTEILMRLHILDGGNTA